MSSQAKATNIHELLKGDFEVEWKRLGELESDGLITLGRGKVISKADLVAHPGEYPVYSSSAIGVGEFGRYGKFAFGNELITWSIDGGGKFFYRHPHKYSVTNVCGWLKVQACSLNIKFLYHVLLEQWTLKKFDYSSKAHPSVIREVYEIPIPPLHIQEVIVETLDKFSQLEAELETALGAELTRRKRQYEWYHMYLLDFKRQDVDDEGRPTRVVLDYQYGVEYCVRPAVESVREMAERLCPEGVKWKKLSEVTQKVSTIKWNKASEAEYQYIDLSSVDRQSLQITDTSAITAHTAPSRARQFVALNDVLFATTRPLQNRRALITQKHDGQICSTGYCVLRATNELISGFLFHILGTQEFGMHVEANQSEGGAYPAIRDAAVKAMLIPIPPLPVQEAIVKILDKFEIIISDFESGIPAEIAARRKQYEYYRKKLLTFDERGGEQSLPGDTHE
jgi:type I restriction enzyme S subunit